MSGTPFPVNPVLTGIVIAYQNPGLIADLVFPRMEPRFATSKFTWWRYDFGQFITVPDTRVGRKSAPNKVEFQASEVNDQTEDYGLGDDIPQADLDNAPAGYDLRGFTAMNVMNLVLLDREVRAANMAFNAGNYSATNKETLAGADQWSHADSKPIRQITEAADSMIIRPNNMVLGRVEWTALRTNPSVLAALTPSGASEGLANKRAVADLLELDDIIVGEGWVNSQKKGQNVVRQRAWSDKALLFHKAPLANSITATPTYGWTAQHGDRVAGSIPDKNIGLRGGEEVRAGESVKEVMSAPELGYLFSDVVA